MLFIEGRQVEVGMKHKRYYSLKGFITFYKFFVSVKDLFQIDLLSRVPIYEQLYQNIVHLILKGVLTENEQLPSVRILAKQLSVNPNTVQKAFQELERNNFIYTVTGRGNFVAPINRKELSSQVLEKVKESVITALKAGVMKEEIIELVREI